jgi:Protein phosphatase inhibitor
MENTSLQAVRWAEDVVDNELMEKKKSKSAPLFAEFLLWCCSVRLVLIK